VAVQVVGLAMVDHLILLALEILQQFHQAKEIMVELEQILMVVAVRAVVVVALVPQEQMQHLQLLVMVVQELHHLLQDHL
jgi:hypothetical protein